MKNIELLISELQKEYAYLSDELKTSIETEDFIAAELFKNALNETHKHLRIMQSLNDPLFMNKRNTRLKIKSIQKLMDELERDNKKLYKLKFLQILKKEAEQELKHLNANVSEETLDNDILLSLIHELFESKISGIIVTAISSAIDLKITNFNDNIKMELLRTEGSDPSGYLNAHYISRLIKNNFILIDGIYSYTLHRNSASPLLILEKISIICLEIFHTSGNRNIKVLPKVM